MRIMEKFPLDENAGFKKIKMVKVRKKI